MQPNFFLKAQNLYNPCQLINPLELRKGTCKKKKERWNFTREEKNPELDLVYV